MTQGFLAQADLARWLGAQLAAHTVIAPVRRGAQLVFRPIASIDEIVWDGGRTEFSAKDFFLPASEAIVTWRVAAEGVRADTSFLDQPQILFGARPCDAHALAVLDRLFLDDPIDLYYAERRAKTTLVGWACADGPWPGCFCTTVGGGPAERSHMDILLTPADGGCIADSVTEKGQRLLASAPLASVDGHVPRTISAVPRQPLADLAAWRARFDDAYWDELAERCLGCRTCTYDCPVCYCFDVRDRRLPEGAVERLRCWDSCQGAQCFAIAGGHNPRPTQASRVRQRYMHKFLYYPSREEGAWLCVGCGRCVAQCPVNIDIREVMAQVAGTGDAAARG
ncbi:MAG: 4Fe-4S dicluster domain-containing protein [Vicinamibacteria bacterium]|nr:4Fe-4S dicluster domain-containing protein [Vicinamibacteria bacterium]